MDYGKLAYMRTEELEARITPTPVNDAVAAGFTPDAPLDGLKLTSLSVGGSAIILIKLVLSASDDVSAAISATFGGLTIADAQISLSRGEKKSELLIGCVNFSGDGEVMLHCDDSRVTAHRVEVGLVGASARVTREAADFRFAEKGTRGLAAVGTSQVVTVYPVAKGIGDGCAVCRAPSFDLAATDDGFKLLSVDTAQNLWLYTLDAFGVPQNVERIGDAVESPTLWIHGDDALAAGIIDGQAVVFKPCPFAARFPVGFDKKADGVFLVKDALTPLVALTSGGKIFLKAALDTNLGRENISVTASIRAVNGKGVEFTWA